MNLQFIYYGGSLFTKLQTAKNGFAAAKIGLFADIAHKSLFTKAENGQKWARFDNQRTGAYLLTECGKH